MLKNNNPIESFIQRRSMDKHPVPLIKSSFDIEVIPGIASVHSTYVFKNVESRPIEAMLTFPVAFDAAVYSIVAKVDGRVLSGKAQAKVEARKAYEEAVDNGKRTVLHEELLRGLHMVSVGNIAPGVEIDICVSYVMPVSLSKGNGSFRIPLTVGQIYGRTPLDESDDIMLGGDVREVDVTIRSARGFVKINGQELTHNRGTVKSNLPMEVQIKSLYQEQEKSTKVTGRLPNGEAVSVSFAPVKKVKAPLKMHVMLDTSGSMRERITAIRHCEKSKWDCVLEGLDDVSHKSLKASDRVTVSTFSNSAKTHGETPGDRLGAYVRNLPFDAGGTDLALGVSTVVKHESEANILLITDGKSWKEIDVQAAIATGARFTVVLVGDDALEVRVGYLAAMTGGQMFIVRGAGVRKAIQAAVRSMRHVASPIVPIRGEPVQITRKISGVEVNVEWNAEGARSDVSVVTENMAKAIGAFSASLAVQAMDEEVAAVYAAEADLVTHLTSIVLVDEEAEIVDGIPATRKVALPAPATMQFASSMRGMPLSVVGSGVSNLVASNDHSPVMMMASGNTHTTNFNGYVPGVNTRWSDRVATPSLEAVHPLQSARDNIDIRAEAKSVALRIDWEKYAVPLSVGDVTCLPIDVKIQIVSLLHLREVKKMAETLNVKDIVALIAILANSSGNKTATVIARQLIGDVDIAGYIP